MRTFLLVLFVCLGWGVSFTHASPRYSWLPKLQTSAYQKLSQRFSTPRGYRRVKLRQGGFGEWLRNLPLYAKGRKVRLYNGRLRSSQHSHAAVVAMDIGRGNLQQCADAVMRLWSEFLWSKGRANEIGFRFTSGHWFPLRAWERGFRPRIVRGRLRGWMRRRTTQRSYRNFRRYFRLIMMFAGTYSLTRELPRVSRRKLRPGDVLLQGGFPGHAVIVLDKAVNVQGKELYLLGQSYMPAQNFHVLRGKGASPWQSLPAKGEVQTPDWTFPKSTYYRLPPRRGRFPR